MRRRRIHLNTVLHGLLIIAMFLVIFAQLQKPMNRAQPRKLQFFGEYSQDGGPWLPLGGTKLSSLDGELLLRGDFGMLIPEGSVITFYAFHINVAVELNGQLLGGTPSEGQCNGEWVSITMPFMGAKDELLLRVSNPHVIGNAQAYIQLLDSIYFGDYEEIVSVVEEQDLFRRFIGFAVLAFAFALLTVALVFWFMHLSIGSKLLPMCFMALCYGGYMWLSAPSVNLGATWTELNTSGLYVSIIAAVFQLEVLLHTCLTGIRKKIVSGLLVFQGLCLLGLALTYLFGGLSICKVLDLWMPILIPCVLLLTALGLWEWLFPAKRYPGVLAFSEILLFAIILEAVNEYLLLWPQRLLLDVLVAFFFLAYAIYGIVSVPQSFRKASRAEKLETDLNQNRIVLAMSQISAHFIFNVLNAISGMCKYAPEKADETVIRFARYLRGNINAMQEERLENFSATLQHLQDYVALEQVRFGDRIRFTVDAQVTDFQLPPLTLQPVVENAIKHGLTPKPEGGSIHLQTSLQGDMICITISDDGVGFNLAELQQKNSVGLNNVRFRLKQIVNGDLQLKSLPGRGTWVSIIIPLEENKDEPSDRSKE